MFTSFFSVNSVLLCVALCKFLFFVTRSATEDPQRFTKIHRETQLIICVLYENFVLFAVKKFLFLYSKIF